jgi:hypothetical protein
MIANVSWGGKLVWNCDTSSMRTSLPVLDFEIILFFVAQSVQIRSYQ